MKSVVDSLPVGGQFFVSLDVDGLDPSVVPGTIALAPGESCGRTGRTI